MWNGVASKKLVVQQQVHMWQACRVTCMKADLTLLPPQPLTPTPNMLTWWTSKNVKTLAWFSLCWHIHVHRIQTFQYSYIPYLFICIYKGIYIYAYIYTGTCRNLSSWKHRFFNEAGFWRTCWKGQKRKPNNQLMEFTFCHSASVSSSASWAAQQETMFESIQRIRFKVDGFSLLLKPWFWEEST